MGQTSCILLGLECHVWHMRNGINVMEYFKPCAWVNSHYFVKFATKSNACFILPFSPLYLIDSLFAQDQIPLSP